MISVGARYAEVQEAFFCRLGDPIHSVVDFYLCLRLACMVIDPEANALNLAIIVATLVSRLLSCGICLDELWLKKLIDFLLLLLPRPILFVFVVMLPGTLHKVKIAANIVLRIL